MAQATDYLENAFLNHYFRATAYTAPTGLELAYWDSSPTDTGVAATEVEPFGAGVRAPLTFGSSSGRSVSNTNTDNRNATGSGTATYLSVQDQLDNMLCYQQIQATPGGAPAPMTFSPGQPIQIGVGAIVINFPQEATTEACHSDTIVDEWLSFVFGPGASTAPTQHFLSLHTGDPGETGLLEFTGGGYVRTASTWNVPSAGASNRQQVTNNGSIDFSNLTVTPIAWWGLWSASTAGTFLTRSDQVDQIISAGDNASAADGALAILAG